MNSSSRDAGIPVLTEIIADAPQPVREDIPAPDARPAQSLQPETQPMEGLEQRALATLGPQDWDRLELQLRERILRQLVARTENLLEQQVRDTLADVLQEAVQQLADQLRDGLHHSLEDMISRAVSQEIADLQSSKK